MRQARLATNISSAYQPIFLSWISGLDGHEDVGLPPMESRRFGWLLDPSSLTIRCAQIASRDDRPLDDLRAFHGGTLAGSSRTDDVSP
jgi:hypothetical protein